MTTTISIARPTTTADAAPPHNAPLGWWPNLENERSRNIVFPQAGQDSITESECNELLLGMPKWVQNFVCGNCGGELFYVIKGRNARQCAACHGQSAVTSGTFFETVPVSLAVWFQAIDAVINARQLFVFNLAKMLRIRYTTAWLVKNQIERALRSPDDRGLVMEIAQSLR